MIGTTLSYIRKRVDDHLRIVNHMKTDGNSPPLADLVDGSQLDPLILPLGTVSILIVDVNEDRACRDADRFQRRISTEKSVTIESHYPDLHLEIGLLFIARFKDYGRAWDQLAHIIGFFQQHPLFSPANDPALPDGIDRLSTNLCPQSLQQINELWSALKTPPHPALLYRLQLLTIRGPMITDQPKQVKTIKTKLTQQPHTQNLRSPPLINNRSK
jgi:hypothetical protein